MTAEEVSAITGLSPEVTHLAREREYGEPFLLEDYEKI